jgi:hypothetical protein
VINFRFDESSTLFSSILLAPFILLLFISGSIDRRREELGAANILISGSISKSEKFSGLFGQRYCWNCWLDLFI